jgi:hypothetical protein
MTLRDKGCLGTKTNGDTKVDLYSSNNKRCKKEAYCGLCSCVMVLILNVGFLVFHQEDARRAHLLGCDLNLPVLLFILALYVV